MIQAEDFEWAAGFLDGEGCFSCSSGGSTIQVQASQVQRWPLDKLLGLFGGRLTSRQPQNPRHSSFWHWSVTGPRAVGVMMTLWSLLSPARKGQIKTSLALWRNKKPTRSRYNRVCLKGHLLEGANVRIEKKNGVTRRRCRACQRGWMRNRRAHLKNISEDTNGSTS